MTTIGNSWDRYRDDVDHVPEQEAMSEASFYTGCLSAIILISQGVSVEQLLQEIEGFGVSCPTVPKH